MLTVVYLLIRMLLSSRIQLNNNEIDDSERMSCNKLILNTDENNFA